MQTPARPPIRIPSAANGATPHPAQPGAYAQPAQAPRPASVSAVNVYAGIETAKDDGRFPWFERPGRYLVTTLGWRCFKTLKGKMADTWDVEILHTYRGDNPHTPGDKVTRMRTQDAYGTWLNEVFTRAVNLLTSVSGEAVLPGAVTPQVMQAITEGGELAPGVIVEGNGSVFHGYPLIVEVMPSRANTRSPGEFTPFNYFIPTAADLAAAGIVQQ